MISFGRFRQNMSRCERFTLLELLITLSIIAVLASMTVIAVGRARQRGMEVQDISNMKQVTVAVAQYAGQSPGACFELPDIPAFLHEIKLLSEEFTCPVKIAAPNAEAYYHHYNSNGFLFHRFRGAAYSKWNLENDDTRPQMFLPVPLGQIKNPSKKILLAEADDEENHSPPTLGAFYPGHSFVLADSHHAGRTLCAWADGHVSFEPEANDRFMYPPENSFEEEYPWLEPEL